MGSPAPVPAAPTNSSRPRKDGPNTKALLAVLNGALAGVRSRHASVRSLEALRPPRHRGRRTPRRHRRPSRPASASITS